MYTTLSFLKDNHACVPGYTRLVKILGVHPDMKAQPIPVWLVWHLTRQDEDFNFVLDQAMIVDYPQFQELQQRVMKALVARAISSKLTKLIDKYPVLLPYSLMTPEQKYTYFLLKQRVLPGITFDETLEKPKKSKLNPAKLELEVKRLKAEHDFVTSFKGSLALRFVEEFWEAATPDDLFSLQWRMTLHTFESGCQVGSVFEVFNSSIASCRSPSRVIRELKSREQEQRRLSHDLHLDFPSLDNEMCFPACMPKSNDVRTSVCSVLANVPVRELSEVAILNVLLFRQDRLPKGLTISNKQSPVPEVTLSTTNPELILRLIQLATTEVEKTAAPLSAWTSDEDPPATRTGRLVSSQRTNLHTRTNDEDDEVDDDEDSSLL